MLAAYRSCALFHEFSYTASHKRYLAVGLICNELHWATIHSILSTELESFWALVMSVFLVLLALVISLDFSGVNVIFFSRDVLSFFCVCSGCVLKPCWGCLYCFPSSWYRDRHFSCWFEKKKYFSRTSLMLLPLSPQFICPISYMMLLYPLKVSTTYFGLFIFPRVAWGYSW